MREFGLRCSNSLTREVIPLFEDVIAQVHDERLRLQIAFGNKHGMGQAERLFLFDVDNADSPARSVTHSLPDFIFRLADDDTDIPDSRFLEGLYPVKEHRLVGDRDKLLGLGEGQGTEPRPFSAAQNQSFHLSYPRIYSTTSGANQ